MSSAAFVPAQSFVPRKLSLSSSFTSRIGYTFSRPPCRRSLIHRSNQISHNVYRYLFRMQLSDVPLNSLTVLVVGSGGREHALVHAISKSPYLKDLLAAPGNMGMPPLCECVPVPADDVDALVRLAVKRSVSFVVVGPEVPLVLGLVDKLREKGIAAFGPSKAASILEGSKVFTKAFLERQNIPTAWYKSFSNPSDAKTFIREKGAPIVVKADGLAAGKGVILAETVEQALKAVDTILVENKFGSAGSQIVVEEFLDGEELSFFALLDGEVALPLASAQDHKAAYDGDKGPNTGGMGSYSPAPVCNDELREQIMRKVVVPTMEGMKKEGREFRGVLYCGLMVDKQGQAKVLEYNVRFGDPECQVLCTRMRSDLLELLYRTATSRLGADDFVIQWDPLSAVVVVLAAKGYPGSYEKGSVIRKIDEADALDGVTVYHAGTKRSESSEFVAAGGRVLGVTATGVNIREAQRLAYEAVDVIDWPEGFCRRDIGWRAIEREQKATANT
ncbi:Phosphoribosylamine--glycine ligase, chloroplastic [Gracilariopsis chorda]|uniref:phosphoribosylamine--glycine ligase n=1 Tax=Gracilariopsis chorda TaxID=448386 RepID=A0A2V3IZK0_9FLOR|nr:Phosphoribosylamine--glycine ligase, chloroplastic [Gracilariopsis chorda]|eukprot:PXF47519.1 Phosphoribosylamine--glycine ligase, chloroplastic [Gracilariopsis chorda]